MKAALVSIKNHLDNFIESNYQNIKKFPLLNSVFKKHFPDAAKKNEDFILSDSLKNHINSHDVTSDIIQTIWINGAFIDINTTLCELLGYTEEEMRKVRIEHLIDDDWKDEFLEIFHIVKTEQQSQDIKFKLVGKSGNKILVGGKIKANIEDNLTASCDMILHVISETEELENSLNKIFDEHQKTDPSIPMVIGSHRGKVLQINQAACDLVGYTYEEMMGMHIRKISHPKDIFKSLTNLRKLLSGQTDNYKIIKRYRHKKGHLVKVELNATLVRNEQGQPRFALAKVRKIED